MNRLPIAALLPLLALPAPAADIPSPEAHLGFRPGADGRLATWDAVAGYLRKVDAASDRVVVRDLGETTEGRPYLVAIVAAPKTIENLERYRVLQRRLARPDLPAASDGADPVAESKAVVLITCSIHSTETASTLMALELLHDLATGDDPATREVLEQTILLLVPSANPDGVDKVAAWYDRSQGKPWEGGGLVELYHKYAGHDTNRDWFMLNLKETRLLTRLLYHEWYPTLTYDVHQMGPKGARLFVPPFFDPINPNLDPRIHQGIALVGSHMAADLTAAGKKGVLTNAMYDNWWNGGNRTTPQRHNMVGVLTEAASVRLASPVFVDRGELAGSTRGFTSHRPATNFADPWPGGWWRLRDILEYEKICARSILTLAARYRADFQRDYRAMGRAAIDRGKAEPPFAWVVPAEQDDPGRAADLVRILHETGVEVRRAEQPLRLGATTAPAGSWVLPAAQPYRAHLKDMMERQEYPARFTGTGAAEPPYDVAGWTLPLQMGVRAFAVGEPLADPGEAVTRIDGPRGRVEGAEKPEVFLVANRADDDVRLLNALLKAGVEVRTSARPVAVGSVRHPAGAYWFAATDQSRKALADSLPTLSTRVVGARGAVSNSSADGPAPFYRIAAPRIGLYQPWVPSMDEGWTRLVLENHGFPYTTLHNADLRAGGLRERFDTLLIPSVDARTLRDGYAADQTEPAYVGGLGGEGVDALRAFVRAGGTLVCLEDSCPLAIDALKLPATNVVQGLPSSTFYGPGSVVAVRHASDTREAALLTLGMPEEGSAYFDRSLAFDVPKGAASVATRYAATDVLQSGWLLGADKIQDRAAVVSLPVDRGRVILFGFPPQHRGQTRGTFRLLFNALLRGGMEAATD